MTELRGVRRRRLRYDRNPVNAISSTSTATLAPRNLVEPTQNDTEKHRAYPEVLNLKEYYEIPVELSVEMQRTNCSTNLNGLPNDQCMALLVKKFPKYREKEKRM